VLLSSHVLSEVAQTVDEIVVINHGRLIAHDTLDALSAGSGSRVRVRTRQPDRLERALAVRGLDVTREGDALVVGGADQGHIAQLAFDHGVVLHEITSESTNLEDVFFDLTTDLEVAA
jgi:ABC-2 type transport system ATP-binding protein